MREASAAKGLYCRKPRKNSLQLMSDRVLFPDPRAHWLYFGIVQKVFSEKASAIARMRQKCIRNASKMRQNGSRFIGKEGMVQNASEMRQKCAGTPFGRYRLLFQGWPPQFGMRYKICGFSELVVWAIRALPAVFVISVVSRTAAYPALNPLVCCLWLSKVPASFQ